MIKLIADAKADREAWLEARKGYLTSSAVFTWRGEDIPFWWGDTRESIIQEKFLGIEKTFEKEVMVSMMHGTVDEEHLVSKVGRALGAPVEACNGLFWNSRYPGLAASIDGFIGAARGLSAEIPELCQEPHTLHKVASYLHENLQEEDMTILEIKKSTSKNWNKKVPDYYYAQLQTQMHILDRPFAVIAADTLYQVAKGRGRFAHFWDLCCHVVERNQDWADYLDQASTEYLTEKAKFATLRIQEEE